MRTVVAMAASLLMIACAPASQPPAAAETAPGSAQMSTSSDLAARLRAAGLTVTVADEIEQPFFTGRARVLRVGDEDVQVYEFPDAAAAANAAGQVAPGGGSIGTTMMSWMAAPHFYRKDRLIVIHLGSDAAVTRALTDLMGPQFAGQS